MTVHYEWDVETIVTQDSDDFEEGEIIDHHHTESFAEAALIASGEPGHGQALRIVLVKDDDEGRSWAYLDEGKLPKEFEDAYNQPSGQVPQRFHKEVERSKTAN